MPDEPDPPPKSYGFKSREFDILNPPTGTPQASAPIRVDDLLRQAAASKPGGVPPVKSRPVENDVHAVLRENLLRANLSGLNELKPLVKRPSRRKRDFWFLMISGNLFLGFLAIVMGITNPFVFASAIAGMGMLTASLTWVMWFIMDDY